MLIFHWRGCQKRISHQTCGFPNKRLFSEEIIIFMMVKQWKARFRKFEVFTIFTCGDPWILTFYEHKSYGLEKCAGSQKMIVVSSQSRFLAGPLSRKRCFCKMARIAHILFFHPLPRETTKNDGFAKARNLKNPSVFGHRWYRKRPHRCK